MAFDKIIECVPNFSEGRDKKKIEKIMDCFRGQDGVVLLDYSSDSDHNRTVVTIAGQPEAVADSVVRAAIAAKDLIDLTKHEGQHPRMGAVDVVPFIPIKNVTDDEALALAKSVGQQLWQKAGIPVFLYEKSATAPHRENLAEVRKGQFEGMAEKMKDEKWQPDFGGSAPHATAGVTAVGFRMPLVAFNVNLDTPNLDVATAIGKKVRFVGGGLRYCKAMGVDLEERKQTQVSMNMTDYSKTPLYFALELIRTEARRYGANVIGTEVIGLVPMQALADSTSYYLECAGVKADLTDFQTLADCATRCLLIENFSINQILEYKLMQ